MWKDLQKINSVKKGMASSQQQFEVDICNKTELDHSLLSRKKCPQ